MKSKSFDLRVSPTQKGKLNRTFDFVSLYKTTEETNAKLQEKRKPVGNLDGEDVGESAGNTETWRREQLPNKKRKKVKNEILDISVINIDSRSLGAGATHTSPVRYTRGTSTPVSSTKPQQAAPKVKSIMKNSTVSMDDAMDSSTADNPTSRSKKRNKSVSFMLDDTEEVVVKKAKSEEYLDSNHQNGKPLNKYEEKKKLKKLKKSPQAEKENNANINMETDQGDKRKDVSSKKLKSKDKSKPLLAEATGDSPPPDAAVSNQDKKKKFKKLKNRNKTEEPTENESNNNDDNNEHKTKKLKKKKHHSKVVHPPDTTETEGEPATKSRKTDVKPEVIAEDLENLSIGDNAHTLTNLLDELTVIDKNKKKKNKLRRKKDKTKTVSVSSSENAELEKIEEGKEKVKWKKRKWNKDRKGDVDDDTLGTTVIVENLPLQIMLEYKTLLAHHFGNLGLIKKIG